MSGVGDVLFANRAALAVLRGTDVLRLDRSGTARGLGKLVAKLPRVNRDIASALSTAKGIDDVVHFSSVIKVPGSIQEQNKLIQLSRVSVGTSFSADGELPEVIAFLTDPSRPLEAAPELLSRSYGLTAAEARAAVAATAAGSLEEIAETLSLSISTVKSHLQQVYAKTGVRGRAELVRLVLGLASAS